jgi:hypothetical protein
MTIPAVKLILLNSLMIAIVPSAPEGRTLGTELSLVPLLKRAPAETVATQATVARPKSERKQR